MLNDVKYLLHLIILINMGVLEGAASGAALGTGISPGAGTVIGAGIGAVGSLLGGVLGKKSQQKANKTNLQIAREQNETQKQLAAENNRLQREMFERQLFYNSPGAQRKMLEDAGLNPYSLVQNGYQALSAPNAPQMQLPAFTTPQVSPENAFAQNLGTIGKDFGEVMKNLAEAGLAKSQAVGQNIDNKYAAAIKEADLVGKGMSNTAQAIQNYINEQSKDWQVETKYQEAQLAESNAKKAFNDACIAAVNHELMVKYGDKIQNAELQKKLSEINFIDTQAATSQVQQLVGYAQIHLTEEQAKAVVENAKSMRIQADAAYKDALANLKNANSNALLAKANVRLINLKADEQQKLNKILDIKADWFANNGYQQMSLELRKLNSEIKKNKATVEQLNAAADMMQYMSMFYYVHSEKTAQEIGWMPFDKLNEMLRSLSGAVSAGSSAAGNLLPLTGIPMP